MDIDQNKRVEERAYSLWEEAGRPEGGAEEFWHRAEQEITGGQTETSDAPGVADAPGKEASAASFTRDLEPGDAGDAKPAPPAKGKAKSRAKKTA